MIENNLNQGASIMGKMWFVLILLLLATVLFGTAGNYQFANTTTTWSPITGTTIVASAQDDTWSGATNIGFGFIYDGIEYTQFMADANGFIRLGNSTTGWNSAYNNAIGTGATLGLCAFWDDLHTGVDGTVQYLLTGTAPNLVLTVQWLSVRHYNGTDTDDMNFQIILEQNGNKVNFVYGTMTSGVTSSASIGIIGATGASGDFLSVTPGATPTVSSSTPNDAISMTTLASGVKYTFDAPASAAPGLPVSPSPATNAAGAAIDGALSWFFGDNSMTYDLMFGPAGLMTQVVTGATCTSGGAGSYTYSGLANGTVYNWQVTVHNTATRLDTSGPTWSFTTAYLPASLPFAEYFDASTIPDGWVAITDGSAANWLINSSNNAGGSPYEAEFSWTPDEVATERLVTRPIQLNGATSLLLQFNHYLNDYNSTDYHLEVQTSPDMATWTTVWTHTPAGSIGPVTEEAPFTASGTGVIYLAFTFIGNSYNVNYWYVDNILLDSFSPGALTGTVTAFGTGAPIVGANVYVSTQTAVTGADGVYTFPTLNGGTYDVAVEANGYSDGAALGVVVTGGSTTTQNFVLNWSQIGYSPTSLSFVTPPDQTASQNITINNTGNAPLTYRFGLNSFTRVSIPAATNNFVPSTNHSTGTAPQTDYYVPGNNPYATRGIAYGAGSSNILTWDTATPGTQNILAPWVGGGWYNAGCFSRGDDSFFYQLNSDGGFYTVDVATGTATLLATLPGYNAETFTDMACDPTNGTIYATSCDITTSSLFIIDPIALTATRIGALSGGGAIALAIDGAGAMFTYDLTTDLFAQVDKATGAFIWSAALGWDANYGQGMCWEPSTDILYACAVESSVGNQLRIFDRTTGGSTIVGSLAYQTGWMGFQGIMTPWVTATPNTGTIEVAGSATVEIAVNTNGMLDGETHTCNVAISNNGVDLTTPSIPLTLNVLSNLVTPQNMLITRSGTSLVLTWDTVPGATGYNIYSSTAPYSGMTLEATVVGTTWTDTSPSAAKKFYQVTATR
jgi:hypothetical protein